MTSSNTMTGDHPHLACTACPARAIGGFGQAEAGKPHVSCENRKDHGTWRDESDKTWMDSLGDRCEHGVLSIDSKGCRPCLLKPKAKP